MGLVFTALIAAASIGALAYSLAARDPAPVPASAGAPQPAPARPRAPPPRGEPATQSTEQGLPAESAPGPVSSDALGKLIAGTTSSDPKARAAAIESLANLPKEQALPVLNGVLNSGEPKTDRPLALRSLRTLAMRQGDEDRVIRNLVLQTAYHSDDEDIARAAQDTYGEIESALSR